MEKYGVYIIAGFLIISELHYDISSLVTGLGLTSVVIALAAQDLVGNVTEIKFRCTRIRTVEDTIVTIKNSTITNSEVVNYTKMTKRRYDTILNLPLETKSEVLENLTIKLKNILEAEEDVNDDSVRVYFDKVDSEGVKIKIYLYTNIVNFDDFLEFKNKINLLIIKTLENENIKISYSGKNLYFVKNK